jgi:hypothetical protein
VPPFHHPTVHLCLCYLPLFSWHILTHLLMPSPAYLHVSLYALLAHPHRFPAVLISISSHTLSSPHHHLITYPFMPSLGISSHIIHSFVLLPDLRHENNHIPYQDTEALHPPFAYKQPHFLPTQQVGSFLV